MYNKDFTFEKAQPYEFTVRLDDAKVFTFRFWPRDLSEDDVYYNVYDAGTLQVNYNDELDPEFIPTTNAVNVFYQIA